MATESFSLEHASIDDEIASLQQRANQLRADLKTHVATLVSSYEPDDFPAGLQEAINKQQAHTQESLWRIGAGVTAFRVRDPDPGAVDGGSVLGIRFEVMRAGRFLQPYVVLLNRPYGGTEGNGEAEDAVVKTYLRVHRHTIPNCIPLGGLAARYLPPPTATAGGEWDDGPSTRKSQNLSLFVKELRQHLVAYHNRLGAVADMRKAAGLGVDQGKRKKRRKAQEESTEQEGESAEEHEDQEAGSDAGGPPRIIEIGLGDAEAKQIRIDWSNGDVCRIVVDDGGEIEKCVMYGAQGRDMPAAREFLQRISRMEKLPESIRRKRGLEPE